MKSSNPLVMVQAYRLLVQKMEDEFGECYPLHLGVTEAGDGEDGRIKSAVGIGTLLEEGCGDTIRVSLTEDPEFEIPVCKDLVKRYARKKPAGVDEHDGNGQHENAPIPFSLFEYRRRQTIPVSNIGGKHVPVVVADFMHQEVISRADLQAIGYTYNESTDKWLISDGAADYIYTGKKRSVSRAAGNAESDLRLRNLVNGNRPGILCSLFSPMRNSCCRKKIANN